MSAEDAVAEAIVTPKRRLSLAWIVPILAMGILVLVIIQAVSRQGGEVAVEFRRGHGLQVGDPVRLRDIQIGAVERLELTPQGDGVVALLRIEKAFLSFMREGSRFWIERPEVGFSGVQGLQTILGAQYVGVLPGDGAPGRRFVGLNEPPYIQDVEPGDLEVVLEASARMGMRVGGVVTYRGMPAGRIRQVELSGDATHVEAHVVIHARYAPLVRRSTRFFATSGVALGLSLEGLRLDVESLESLVAGGIAFATPPDGGKRARTGARYALAERYEDDWLAWEPRVAIGEFGMGTNTAPPIERVQLRWETRVLRLDRSRSGWMLPLETGALLPGTLCIPPDDVRDEEFLFQGTAVLPSALTSTPMGVGVYLVDLEFPEETLRYPEELLRGPKRGADGDALPEMLLVWRGGEPLPISPHEIDPQEAVFRIDPSISFATDSTGAPVTSAEDGGLVGILLVTKDGRGKVAFIESPSR